VTVPETDVENESVGVEVPLTVTEAARMQVKREMNVIIADTNFILNIRGKLSRSKDLMVQRFERCGKNVT
jgi:hypothetical protein